MVSPLNTVFVQITAVDVITLFSFIRWSWSLPSRLPVILVFGPEFPVTPPALIVAFAFPHVGPNNLRFIYPVGGGVSYR